ncbi:MAG: FAD-dependent oxidoreductase [Candidatus Tectomicrobia bacterium]|uniref:FAD-dependent oxidoreductase n=1 Tax=Tectimicrobiota bacterium TaxID=2528274 RepID=A0A933GK33_UNCTE|nr:FAD-dependent oxidoreductase [Candidatus Tectomicrobia bacterium]
MFPHLSKPINIGKIQLNNRLAVAPTVHNLASEEGYVTDRLMEIYRSKGRGGWGLITVEATYLRMDGRNFSRMLGIYTDKHVPGLNELAEAIKEDGVKASLQIMHGGRLAAPRFSGTRPLAPSAISRGSESGGIALAGLGMSAMQPKEMVPTEIEEVIDSYVAAALRVKEAGFDMVTIHGAHGFLVSQFMSRYQNRRGDKYGNPAAFPVEIIKRIRKAAGPDFPIIIRISGDEYFGDKGITIAESLKLCPQFQAAGADCIDVSAGGVEGADWAIQPLYFPRGCIVHLAEQIKKVVSIPVITVGRINDPILAEEIVASEKADIVAMCRGAIADPELPKKAFQGRVDEIRKCIACDLGCTDRMASQRGVMCAVNYQTGRVKPDFDLPISRSRKKVLVVGGGVAGMEAARVATLRGHEVNLYEKSEQLGGAVASMASAFPRLYTRDLYNIVEYLQGQMNRLEVKVELKSEVTVSLIEEKQPDAIVFASGAETYKPELSWMSSPKVFFLEDYLRQQSLPGERVVIVGGHHGCEAAVSLAREKKKVTIVEESDALAMTPYIYIVRRIALLRYVEKEKVAVLSRTKIKEMNENKLVLLGQDGRQQSLEFDSILIALGRNPNRHLINAINEKWPGLETYEIGDCREPRNIMAAVHEGFRAGQQI